MEKKRVRKKHSWGQRLLLFLNKCDQRTEFLHEVIFLKTLSAELLPADVTALANAPRSAAQACVCEPEPPQFFSSPGWPRGHQAGLSFTHITIILQESM